MRVSRALLTTATLGTKSVLNKLNKTNARTSSPLVTVVAANIWFTARTYTVNHLSKNLELITLDRDVRVDTSSSTVKVNKPLVIMLPWLGAKPGNILKYADIYIDQGFDVLTACITPWQMLWPVTGSQVVADELVDFLHHNPSYSPMMIHGFSVGAYLWGEVCARLNEQGERQQHIVDRIVGQVWDSMADVSVIPVGFPRALFPRSRLMQNLATMFIRSHMRVFHASSTIHYIRSSQMYHSNRVTAPALFLLSKTDPVGTEENNKVVRDTWATRGVQTYWKCWDQSPHVGHFRKHPQEYVAELHSFLNKLGLIQHPEKIRAKL